MITVIFDIAPKWLKHDRYYNILNWFIYPEQISQFQVEKHVILKFFFWCRSILVCYRKSRFWIFDVVRVCSDLEFTVLDSRFESDIGSKKIRLQFLPGLDFLYFSRTKKIIFGGKFSNSPEIILSKCKTSKSENTQHQYIIILSFSCISSLFLFRPTIPCSLCINIRIEELNVNFITKTRPEYGSAKWIFW